MAAELPPVAFARYPIYSINAIAPYDHPEAAKSPASICIVDPANPNRPPLVIYDDPTGALFDMNLSFDAKTVFFSARSAKRPAKRPTEQTEGNAAATAEPLALRRGPSIPRRPDWGTNGTIDFVKVVQPILDQHCVECHSGPEPDGLLDLSGDKTAYFNMAYNQLVDRDWVQYLGPAAVGHGETSTRALGSPVSRICRYFEKGHHGTKVTDQQRRTIYTWIDANIPYYGTYEYTDGHVMGARDRWYVHDKDKWFQKDFLPVFDRRCQKCHERPVRDIHIYNYNPGGPVMVTSDTWPDSALNQFQFGYGRPNYLAQIGPAHRINLTHPEWSLMLRAPLPKAAGGLGLCQTKEGFPRPFVDKNDSDYQAMLRSLQIGRDTLSANPRVDMPTEVGED